MLRPRYEQHGAFQDVSLDGLCLAKPKQQALDRIPRQHALKLVAVLPCVIEQPHPDGRRGIFQHAGGHCIALM
jgi:hypothetical protein